MKKNLLLVLGMCVVLGISACGKNVDSDVTSESLPVTESTEQQKESNTAAEKDDAAAEAPKLENLQDYLDVYGQDSIEGQYITVGKVPGLTFVPVEQTNGQVYIAIYNNGEQCGWIGTDKFDSADWMEDAEHKLMLRFSSHSGGAEVTEEIETDYGKCFIVVDDSNLPFAYTDTEWLVNAGVFESEKEATSQYNSRYFAVYGAAGSEYAYNIAIDKHFMNDELFENLLSQILFKKEAFTKEGQEGFVKEIQEVFCEFTPPESIYREDDLFERVFDSNNRNNMQVRFKVEDLTYKIPDNMLAIQMGKGVWNLFKYSMTNGAKEIGTVEYLTVDVKSEELEEALQEFVPDAKYKDTEVIKKGQIFIFEENGEEMTEHIFVVPKKGETVLHLHYKVF